MSTELEVLLQDRVLKNFYKVSQIPRNSGQEEKISNFLMDWAKEHGLEAAQDKYYNVMMKKPATAGYENAPVVLLQAHIDMVCEKVPESDHDFTKDPIKWVIEDDMISTGGETTLGADNGIGVAFAMAVLESDDIAHPALEVAFTADEEESFSGAIGYDASWINADYLINLDHGCDQEILLGSCGGIGVKLELPAEKEALASDWKCYRVAINGLPGGHSGEDIHRGNGNANQLLARTLRAFEKAVDFKLCQVSGGTFRTAIARDSECVIAVASSDADKVTAIVAELAETFKREYQCAAPKFAMTITEAEAYEYGYPVHKLIQVMMLAPDGIWEMSNEMEFTVASSDNMGEVTLEEDGYKLVFEIRCAKESTRNYIMDILETIAGIAGASFETFTSYPSWEFRPVSKLRAASEEAFRQVYGTEPRELILHAGLECGFFMDKKPSLDAISIGPNCYYFHSPLEKLSISSTKRTWEFFVLLLAALK